MYRKKKQSSYHSAAVSGLNETARMLDRAISSAGVPSADKDAFLRWTVASLWDTFKKERMNQRIVIENEIKALGIRLPNGTVKKDYAFPFWLPVDKISDIKLSGAEELGLEWNYEGDGLFMLTGRPVKTGDYTLKLTYSTVAGEPRSELSIPVAFNSNPRDLWRNIPTSADIEYPKADSATEYVKVPADDEGHKKKDIIAASQRGRSHAHEGRPRDDHFSLFHCPKSDWYIMAVADGAGSSRFSREGSRRACESVVAHCRERLLDNPALEDAIKAWHADQGNTEKRTALTRHVIDIIYNGALKAHEAVKREAEERELNKKDGTRLKDYATTLMFAVCKKFDFGWFLSSFWVGDGAMCLYDAENKTAKLLGKPDEGEFSGQTRFLTMPEIFRDPDIASKRLRMAVVPDFTALFLMTDGVSDPMFETDNNLNDYAKWEEFYTKLKKGFPADEIGGVDIISDDNEEAAQQLLKWLDFWSPGNHDDRTLVILC